MRLSRQVQYALCGLFDLAYHGAGTPVRVEKIAARQAIPHRFLEQVFRRLRQAELVRGKRGPGGGYVLNRAPEEISLREILEAVEGDLTDATLEDNQKWVASEYRPDFAWPLVADRISEVFGEILLSDLCRDAIRRGTLRDLPEAFDYQI